MITEILDKGNLRSEGGDRSLPPPPPSSGYWPESGFPAFPPPGYPENFGMGMWGMGAPGWEHPYGDAGSGKEREVSLRNEIDMDEL